MIKGVEFGEFQQALLDAFDEDDLTQMVRVRLNQRLDAIVGSGPFKHVVFRLLLWADQQGTSVVVDLARAAYLERPHNDQIRRIYENFGMAPALSFQQAGAAVAGAPQRATAGGLEATVRPRLKAVDMSLWRQTMAQIEGRVCRVESNGNALGTGFLIGPDLVLTNYHVVEAAIEGRMPAAQLACRFDYKVLADGSRADGTTSRLHDADWCVDASRYSRAEADNEPDRELPAPDELDCAVVRLARPIGSDPIDRNAGPAAPPRGWITLPEIQTPLEKDMPLMIAQHPDGRPLKLALDTQSILGVNQNGTRVRYATNTDHGSSGSPCFNMDWELVALHHMGDPAWKAPMFNEGIPIGVIRSRLASKFEVSQG